MYNFYFQHGDAAVLAIPRCGSESLASGHHLTIAEAKAFSRVLAFARDPFGDDGRIVSSYRFFLRWPQDPRHAPTYEAHVDRILNGQKGADYTDQVKEGARIKGEPRKLTVDPHWIPQATLIAEAPVPVTEVYLLSDLSKVVNGISHFHQTTKVAPVDLSYRLAELLVYYAADVALLSSL